MGGTTNPNPPSLVQATRCVAQSPRSFGWSLRRLSGPRPCEPTFRIRRYHKGSRNWALACELAPLPRHLFRQEFKRACQAHCDFPNDCGCAALQKDIDRGNREANRARVASCAVAWHRGGAPQGSDFDRARPQPNNEASVQIQPTSRRLLEQYCKPHNKTRRARSRRP